MTFHAAAQAWYAGLPGWLQILVQAAVVGAVGALVVIVLMKWIDVALKRAPRIDETVRAFLGTLVGFALWALLGIVILGVFGVNAAALAGIIAVGGFVVGFAVKDVLANFASGVMLLVYRPYRVGEVAKVGSETGLIVSLGLALTQLRTGDGRIVTIPNAMAMGSEIINLTREPRRRAEVDVGISYTDDIDVAMKAIFDSLAKDPRVLEDPKPQIWITELGDNSVNLSVRAWVATKDIWSTLADLRKFVKKAVEDAGCSIPFPQRDVHLYPTSAIPVTRGGNGDGAQALPQETPREH